jgi:hypothetical protein
MRLTYIISFLILLNFGTVLAFDFPHTIVNIDYEGNLTNLSEMQDVNIPAPTDNQVLQYSSGTDLWVAATISGLSDTNASTACTGTDYLAGNGSCLDVGSIGGDTNETIRLDNLVNNNCTGNDRLIGHRQDGEPICAIDQTGSGTNYTHLSNFTDDLGNRGYTSLSNFSNDRGFFNNIINFTASLTNMITLDWGNITNKVPSDFNYLILSKWQNITGVPNLLSNFTDNLGDRGYTSISNFSNDRNFFNNISNFTGSLTNDKICTYDSTQGIFNCTYTDQTGSTTDVWINSTGDIGTGNYNLTGGTFHADTYTANSINYTITDDGSDMFVDFSGIGGTNSLFIETAGTFLEIIANPGASNDYEMFAFEETQGADTAINFYEGGVGRNRIWNSGSSRIGGGKDSSCSNITNDVDCDTASTGADLVVEDDGWYGGKLFASDWSNFSGTKSQISDFGVPYNSTNFPYTSLSNFTNDRNFFNNISNFTGTLTNGKICTYDSTQGIFNCTYTDQLGGGGNPKTGKIYLYNTSNEMFLNITLAGTNLSVNNSNSTDWFNGANSTNSTQFTRTNGRLDIVMSWLVSTIRGLISGFFDQSLNVTSNVTFDKINGTGNISTDSFFVGDGSKLTNLPAGSETDPQWTGNQSFYYNISNPYGFYNITNYPYTSLSNFSNDRNFFNNISNFTGSLTNGKLCLYDQTQDVLNCTYTDQTGSGGNTTDQNLNTTQQVEFAKINASAGWGNVTINGSQIIAGVIDFLRLPDLTNMITLDWGNITNKVSSDFNYLILSKWFTNDIFDNSTLARIGDCPSGQFVQNTTTGGVECATPVGGSGGNTSEEMQDAIGESFNATMIYDDANNIISANESWFTSIYLKIADAFSGAWADLTGKPELLTNFTNDLQMIYLTIQH